MFITEYLTFCRVAGMLFYLIFKFKVFMAITFPTSLRNKDILSANDDHSKSIPVVAKDTKLPTKPSKIDVLEKYVNPYTILIGGLALIIGCAIYTSTC